MRRNDIIFRKCSTILNAILNLILCLILFLFRNDKLFIFLYLPEESQKFIKENNKKKKELSQKELEYYEFAVQDIKYLDNNYKNIEATLMANEDYIPSRENLIEEIKKEKLYALWPLLKIILQTIIFIAVLIGLILLIKEFHCIDDIYLDINERENNKTNNTSIINTNKTNHHILNNAFWYCKFGKCQVKIQNWSWTKIFIICHFVIFYGLIIFYKYILLFTFKKLEINIWALVTIKIVKILVLLFKLKLDYEDDKTCYISKKIKMNI